MRFYEDDEPADVIAAVFARGEKGVTAPAARGFNEWLDLPWTPLLVAGSNGTVGGVRVL